MSWFLRRTENANRSALALADEETPS
jgi:hypothetical protein